MMIPLFQILSPLISHTDYTFDFHVSKAARQRYAFEQALYSLQGTIVVADLAAARKLSQKINAVREAEGIYDRHVTPGMVNGLGLVHEIFHFILRYYEEQENPGVYSRFLKRLLEKFGEDGTESTLLAFIEEFPPLAVQSGKLTPREYLKGITKGKPNRELLLEELLLLYLSNINPAFQRLQDLFDDSKLKEKSKYKEFLKETKSFFKSEKPFSLENLPLIDALENSILGSPSDVGGQLEYFMKRWHIAIAPFWRDRILKGWDLLAEDTKLFTEHGHKGAPPVPQFPGPADATADLKRAMAEGRMYDADAVDMSYFEEERFTSDIEWMPNVVMLAKNSFVWMAQLSKKYKQDIYRLDQIPDEELDQLARWNFNALWLIGVWERSNASKRIKQFCGNPEAAPSAYSLFDYDIAGQLGGQQAYENLRERCAQRGIKLASDMVPNHTGIFSRWLIEHPDFYIQNDYPPFPGYSFTGPDLSEDGRYQIRIEDKYYSKEDAAVVFQMVENETGRVRYIYHGNDGTNMPWNDTAQLNLLIPEVREALIQQIMSVARKFPIIRFDAAMTLAKKHFQRLWFPQPGAGGAIPSRADYGMTRQQFDEAIPIEFWREVVDRINHEMPETLLLAEAFWLMEGYFVRTLGMHRVYNSAFMHMFMKEDNQNYRLVIKNTIEFDPEILKRYVNFMSNPDEETAVNQFGKGDKYFGVAAMMVTMPGLPMFAHGQIEGYTEKYGMEYYKAYYDEYPDEYLVRRHEAEIFPLLSKRYLFSQVDHFEIYDFIAPQGHVNENVFAFSNVFHGERSLALFNNSYEQAEGYIRYSTGKAYKRSANPDDKELRSKRIDEALQLRTEEGYFYVFYDTRQRLEYIRSGRQVNEEGFGVNLFGYQYYVFLNFREVFDSNGEYRQLAERLNGAGVPSIETALKEMKLQPLHDAFRGFYSADNIKMMRQYTGLTMKGEQALTRAKSLKQMPAAFRSGLGELVNGLNDSLNLSLKAQEVAGAIDDDLAMLKSLNTYLEQKPEKKDKLKDLVEQYTVFHNGQSRDPYKNLILIYYTVRRLTIIIRDEKGNGRAPDYYSELMLYKPLWQSLLRLDDNYSVIKREFDLIEILSSTGSIFKQETEQQEDAGGKKTPAVKSEKTVHPGILELMENQRVQAFTNYHDADGAIYYNKENFELLLYWNFTLELLRQGDLIRRKEKSKTSDSIESLLTGNKEFNDTVKQMAAHISDLLTLSDNAGYKYRDFAESVVELAGPAKKKAKTKKG